MTMVPDDRIFRLMAERVQDYAIFVLDRQGCVASWNTGAQRIKQYTAAEIMGKHFSIFYTPEDLARKWPEIELKRAMLEGRIEDEGWRVRKDGTRFWANVIITALRDDKGILLGYSKITRDLTERKRQEEAKRESDERFRVLVEGVQDYAIYMLNPDGVVTSWNAGARRIKGYEASEIVGKHFSAFYEPQDVEAGKPWSELAMAREHGRAEDQGWRLRKDGSRFWARVVVTALHDQSGELRGFAKVTQDLTQRRHAEALEETARQINDFIAVLAHELRNPLAPIRNAAAIMKVIKPGQAEFEAVRLTIDRQSAQLARIVDDLLDISRITRGTLTLQRERQDVREVIARAVEAARPGIEAARHVLELQIPKTALFVHGDAVRLSQALTNILNNAARYTASGGRIRLEVRRESGGDTATVAIAVKDTGQGIDAQLLGSIFGMFVQGRSGVERTQSGLGVGLALARSIVELHHGSIEAHSEGLGKGSEFIVRIPEMRADAAPQAASAAKPAGAETPANVKRILVVDDNTDAASMLSELLRAHGHEVVTVNGGIEALEEAESFRPDIVMLDLGMPGMNGFELARRLRQRKRQPEPLIVAVTGWGKPEDEQRGREAGIDLHLVKPVEGAHLDRMFDQISDTRH